MQILQLFFVFFAIGMFSIGGGYAIIPLIQEQVVERYAWIAQNTFADIITISQMTPGPLAVNTATFVGVEIAGVSGAIAATLGCIIAGIFIAFFLYRFFQKHRSSKLVLEVLNALKASSLGLIVSAAAVIMLTAFTGGSDLRETMSIDFGAVAMFAASFFALRKWKASPIVVVSIAGIIGAIMY